MHHFPAPLTAAGQLLEHASNSAARPAACMSHSWAEWQVTRGSVNAATHKAGFRIGNQSASAGWQRKLNSCSCAWTGASTRCKSVPAMPQCRRQHMICKEGTYTAIACPPKVNKMLVAPVRNCCRSGGPECVTSGAWPWCSAAPIMYQAGKVVATSPRNENMR